ncbi:MAG: TlpA family protein disulfide reductase [Planctomycetota bacterium]|jgi:thiol-disulfide isomerase/thioredoxin|nr:MAG: TlpA family protein disulfide reductase [Planctomycetota bacterium]
MIPSRTLPAAVGLLVILAGCDAHPDGHPALGRPLEPLPVVSLADPPAAPPEFAGKVTLLNLWGTWCPPCRRELPALVRLAGRLAGDARFQLVAISCGPSGDEQADALAAETRGFLAAQRLAVEAWVFADPLARAVFTSQLALEAFPTTYLVGPDARVRAVWVGYRAGDEAAMAAAVLALLKEQKPVVEAAR